jgi:hypothetical protein
MKKITYLIIVLISLSFTSCREQEDLVQQNDNTNSQVSKTSAKHNSSTTYQNFESSVAEQGDPAKPPKD